MLLSRFRIFLEAFLSQSDPISKVLIYLDYHIHSQKLYIFDNSILAWSKNPTMTIIETMTYPIDRVPFPSVTICPKSSNPDRWGPVIKVFDYLQRKCPSNE